MAELTGESVRSELQQVVQETLCQELSEVVTRVQRAVREEIQSFVERWFTEYDVRAPKRCDGHLAEPLKALGESPKKASSSPPNLLSTLPTLALAAGLTESSSPRQPAPAAPAAGSAESNSASSSTKAEDDKSKRSDAGSSRRRISLIRPEILRDCATSSSSAALEASTPSSSSAAEPNRKENSTVVVGSKADSSSTSDGKAQPERGTYTVSSHYTTMLPNTDALEKIKEVKTDNPEKGKEVTGKKDRKISFSDFDEPPKKKSGRPRNQASLLLIDENDKKQSSHRDMTKVVPLPESPCEAASGNLDTFDTSLGSMDSECFLASHDEPPEADGDSCDDDFSGADTWDIQDHPQWVMDIQKTLRTCTTQIFERKRCRPPDWWIRLVESAWFDYFATSFVILNAITIGVQADWSVRHLQKAPPPFFNITEKVFCAVFTVELLMRVSIHGILFFSVPGWKWNIFDTIVVSLQLVEEGVNLVAAAGNEDGEGSTFGGSSVLRVLRILRLLRVFRIVRIVRFVSELRTMVCSIANSMRSLFWTVILIFLMIYVVGVYLTQLVSDHGSEHPQVMEGDSALRSRYGGLAVSILSLFQAMTGGVDWEELANPLMEEISPLLGLLFTVYIAFAVLAMMNVVTAVFIETALENANKDKDTDAQTYIRKFVQSDETGQDDAIDETITWEEFKQRLRNPVKQRYFRALDLDIAEAKGLFQLLDTEGDGRIQVEEFVSWFLQLRGPAKAIDLATVMYNHKRLGTDWAKHAQFVEETLVDIMNTMPGKLGVSIRTSSHRELQNSRQRNSVQWPSPVMGALSKMRQSVRKSNQRDSSRKSVASGKGSVSQAPNKHLSVYSVMSGTGPETSDSDASAKKT